MGAHSAAFERNGDGAWLYGEWVNEPAQNRSEKTFFRFLDAAEQLLDDGHWHEVSVQRFVKEADASVGSFYNRFQDKEALLHCLDGRLGQECELTVDSLLHELELCRGLLPNAAQIMVSLLMRLCTERGGVIRALDIAAKTSPAGTYTGFNQRLEEALGRYAEHLKKHDDVLAKYDVNCIVGAFLETFTIAREAILYRKYASSGETLHVNLMRHFRVSLMSWN